MQDTLIGVRAYLVEENVAEHIQQARDIRRAFADGFIQYLACGQDVPAEIRACVDEVIHYSRTPAGVGVPTEKIIRRALADGYRRVVILDGDRQHRPEQIARICAGTDGADLALVQREKRVLFSREKLDGKTLEDLQNAFIRKHHAIAAADLTPGAYVVFRPEKLAGAQLEAESWIGDYLLLEHALRNGMTVSTPTVDVHTNIYTISNKRLAFAEIAALERFYGERLTDIAACVRQDPYQYLHGGNLGAIDDILDEYRQFKYTEKIAGIKALVLAGGKGTRLRPFTDTIQKQVFPIANKPILHFIMEKITQAGITDIGVIVGPNQDQIRKALGDGSQWNAHITYIEQDRPAGLAHAVQTARPFLADGPFLMYLGDNIISTDLTGFLLDFLESGHSSIITARVKNPSAYGIVETDAAGKIQRLVEKPLKPRSDLAIVGIYAFTPDIFDAIGQIRPSARGELEITDAIQRLIQNGRPLDYRVIPGWWVDTGTFESILDANALILDAAADHRHAQAHVDAQSTLKGRIQLGAGCHIINSTIIGPASIAEDTTVQDAFIGPYTTIGRQNQIKNTSIVYSLTLEGCHIQDAGELAFSIIGTQATVVAEKRFDKVRVIAGQKERIQP